MKAFVFSQYGSPEVLELKEVEKPVPKKDELLIKVRASSVNAGDHFSLQGSPWLARLSVGFPRPKNYILGWDVAGCIEAVGRDVTGFQPGDEIYGVTSRAFAQYATGKSSWFAGMPSGLTFEQAAAVPTAAQTALQALRDVGKLKSGQKVLINGASGGVGSFAVQIAKALGGEVTGVCSSRNVEMVRSIGADHVIDYTENDFTLGDHRYDIILDNVGNRSFSDTDRVLSSSGIMVSNTGHGGMGYVFKAMLRSIFTRRQGRLFVCKSNRPDLEFLKDHLESKNITPVIDRTFRFNEIPEAVGYLGGGHARGKVVITVE